MMYIRKGYATTSHGQMHYAEMGAGPPLVLVGETPRSSRFFTPILPFLAPRVRAIAFDLPGLGNSHPLPEPMSVEAIATCVADALDALGIQRAHLFGMHTGNKVAAAIAADRPGLVDRLILAGQTHSLFPDIEKRNDALRPAFSHYKAAENEQAAGKPLREWLRTKLILDTMWWPEPLLTGAAEEEAIASAEAKTSDFPARLAERHPDLLRRLLAGPRRNGGEDRGGVAGARADHRQGGAARTSGRAAG